MNKSDNRTEKLEPDSGLFNLEETDKSEEIRFSWRQRNKRLLILLGVLLVVLIGFILILVWKSKQLDSEDINVVVPDKVVKETYPTTQTPTLVPTVTPKMETKVKYMKIEESPPEGMVWYQDTVNGFAFAYPEEWKLSTIGRDLINMSISGVDKFQGFLFPRTKSLTGNVQVDLISRVTIYCAADGPTGSVVCPEDRAKFKTWISSEGVDGFEIERIKVEESFLLEKQVNESLERVIAYELPESVEYFAIAFMPYNTAMDEEIGLVGSTFRRLPKKGG